jgi:hypothetical protein
MISTGAEILSRYKLQISGYGILFPHHPHFNNLTVLLITPTLLREAEKQAGDN